jgi:hypothetical protein
MGIGIEAKHVSCERQRGKLYGGAHLAAADKMEKETWRRHRRRLKARLDQYFPGWVGKRCTQMAIAVEFCNNMREMAVRVGLRCAIVHGVLHDALANDQRSPHLGANLGERMFAGEQGPGQHADQQDERYRDDKVTLK